MKRTDSNEWLLREKGRNRAKIGLTKEAAQELEEIVFVKLPKLGQVFKAEDEAVILESVKAAADTYAPIGGRIVSINEKLLIKPNLVITDPHGEGWLYEIEFESDAEYQALQDYKC